MNKSTSELLLRREAAGTTINRPLADATKSTLSHHPVGLSPALALHEQVICSSININRPAKPMWISVLTLKSRGFFIACIKFFLDAARSAI